MAVAKDVLLNMPLLRGIGARNTSYLASVAQACAIARGSFYARRGTALIDFGWLMKGALKLRISHHRTEQIFGIVKETESFAEASIVRHSLTPFDIVALENSVVVSVPLASIESLLEQNEIFRVSLARTLAQRTLAAVENLELVTCDVSERFARYLASHAELRRGKWQVELPALKSAIAARLSMEKETFSRLMRRLIDDELISVEGRQVTILKRKELERLPFGKRPLVI